MATITPQAEKVNKAISDGSAAVFGLLSDRGKQIYFPHEGILGQTAEAKGTELNATIGIACEDDGTVMALDTLKDSIDVEKGEVFPYAPSFGKKELREKWQELIKQKNPSITGDISLPNVTVALTHGLSMIGYLFADSETEFIIPNPYWGNYKLTFDATYGSRIKPFDLFADGGFNIDGLKAALADGDAKKILVLNFPNNPTGYTPTEQDAEKIVDVIKEYCTEKQLIVICDDAYFGLVFEDGVLSESMFSKLYNLSEKCVAVKIDGITKEDYAWGLRVGFVTFGIKNATDELYRALEDKTAGAVRATVSNAPNVSQALILKALSSPGYNEEKAKKRALIKSRYDKIKTIIADNQEDAEVFTQLPCNSGYFMCFELSGGLDAEEVRHHLLDKYKTGTISVGSTIRVAFSSISADKLEAVFENIYKACNDLKE